MGSNQSIQFFTGINPPYNNVQKDMFGRKQRNASTGPASILTGKLDPIEQKRDIARKRAYKIMSDAYAGEKKIYDDIKNRLGLMDHYLSMYGEANDKLREIDDRKEALRQEYGVDKDSQEQKDLEILEKYNDIKERLKLESDDLMRALELVNKGYQDGYTEYQRRALEIHKGREPYLDQLTEAKKGLIEESGALRSIALERLKYHPIVDALEDADKVMENLSDEIKGMLMDEAVDHVDEKSEEEIEKAEENKEEKKEEEEKIEEIKERREELEALMDPEKAEREPHRTENESDAGYGDVLTEAILKMDGVKTNIQQEVSDMVSKMKLVAEDLKGLKVDELL